MHSHLEDFTLSHYRQLIALAKETHPFITYKEALAGKHGVLWRHDLDLSPEAGWQTAKIEAEAGVKANYFFLLHSPFYNPLDSHSYPLLKEIVSMGHHVGLHFDAHIHSISSEAELDKRLRNERELLRLMFGVETEVFSFHLTNDFTMICDAPEYGGMVNTYSAHIKTAIPYRSDSYGIWRFGRMQDFLAEHRHTPQIQVLTHPEWWIHEPMAPKDRIDAIIRQHSERLWADAHKSYIYESRPQ